MVGNAIGLERGAKPLSLPPCSQMPGRPEIGIGKMDFLQHAYRLYNQSHIPFFAASLAYYALFSLMPLLFLLVGVFGLVLAGNEALLEAVRQRLSEVALLLFPTQPDLAQGLLKFLTSGAAPLTAGSFLVLFWSASNFFAALAYAMGVIFQTPPGFRNRLIALIAPGALGLGLILLALGGLSLAFILRYLPPELGFLRGSLEHVLPVLGTVGLFYLTYRLLPRPAPRRLHALSGAGFAALVWEGVRLGIPALLPRSQYELFYGPLAGFLLAMLGFYLSMWILLVGGLLARVLEDWHAPKG